MLQVLLVSPQDPVVPGALKFLVGGENTYTTTLLKYPPKGIKYVHFEEALKRGFIEYLPENKILGFLVKLRILPLSSGSRCLKLNAKFDLVHCHGFSVKIEPSNIPVVLSDSSSNYLFLKDYVNWPEWRIKLGYFLRKNLFNWLGVIDSDTNPDGAKKVIVFSKFAQKLHLKLRVPKEKLVVVQPGLQIQKANSSVGDDKRVNILFVGTWFERKGGRILLEAFEKLSKKFFNVRLTIVGEVPNKLKVESEKLKVYKYVPRERLMREFFPRADIFILVPPKVEGYGFSVVEAMSFGIPVIVSNVCALPELVEDGKSGFVVKPGSIDDLVEKIERLVANKSLREKMGELAKKRFEHNFTVEKSNEQLLEVFKNSTLS